jgi:hypothetical protein
LRFVASLSSHLILGLIDGGSDSRSASSESEQLPFSDLITPLSATELTAFLSSLALQSLPKSFFGASGCGTASDLERFRTQSPSSSHLSHSQSLWLLSKTLQLCGVKEHLGEKLLQLKGRLSESLFSLPADANALLEAAAYAPDIVGAGSVTVEAAGATSEDGGGADESWEGTRLSRSVFDACAILRRVSLSFYNECKGKHIFSPSEELLFSPTLFELSRDSSYQQVRPESEVMSLIPDDAPIESPWQPISLVNQGSIEDAKDKGFLADHSATEAFDRHHFSHSVARPLSGDDVRSATSALLILRDFLFNASTVADLEQRRDEARLEMREARERASSGGADYLKAIAVSARNVHALDATLLAYALAARTLHQSDVLVFLLHLVFSLSLGESSGLNGGRPTEAVCMALSWALQGLEDGGLSQTQRRKELCFVEKVWAASSLSDPTLPFSTSTPASQTASMSKITGVFSAKSVWGQAHSRFSLHALGQTLLSCHDLAKLLKQDGASFPASTVARAEAQLLLSGLSHPAVGAGVIHSFLSLLTSQKFANASADGASLGKAGAGATLLADRLPSIMRSAAALAQRFPAQLACPALLLARVALELMLKTLTTGRVDDDARHITESSSAAALILGSSQPPRTANGGNGSSSSVAAGTSSFSSAYASTLHVPDARIYSRANSNSVLSSRAPIEAVADLLGDLVLLTGAGNLTSMTPFSPSFGIRVMRFVAGACSRDGGTAGKDVARRVLTRLALCLHCSPLLSTLGANRLPQSKGDGRDASFSILATRLVNASTQVIATRTPSISLELSVALCDLVSELVLASERAFELAPAALKSLGRESIVEGASTALPSTKLRALLSDISLHAQESESEGVSCANPSFDGRNSLVSRLRTLLGFIDDCVRVRGGVL